MNNSCSKEPYNPKIIQNIKLHEAIPMTFFLSSPNIQGLEKLEAACFVQTAGAFSQSSSTSLWFFLAHEDLSLEQPCPSQQERPEFP